MRTSDTVELKLTKKEMDFVAYFMDTEYGRGCGYVFYDEWDMNTTRGIMSSLVKKGVIVTIDENWKEAGCSPSSWVSFNMDMFTELGKILDENKILWRWD